jgi:hypothetical protein
VDFDVPGPPSKAAATVAISREALRALDLAAQAALVQMLVSASARATDAALVTMLTAGAPTTPATVAGVLAALVSPSRPFLLADYETLLSLDDALVNKMATLGIGILPTAAAAGAIIALDAVGLVVQDGGIDVATARHATVTMTDDGVRGHS